MDIKWKSSPKKIKLAVSVLLITTIVTMAFYPGIIRRGEADFASYMEQKEEDMGLSDDNVLDNIYKGCYVLYKESKERKSGEDLNDPELFIDAHPTDHVQGEQQDDIAPIIDFILTDWEEQFEICREYIDYAVLEDGGDTNTGMPLKEAVDHEIFLDSDLASYYREIFQVRFNENGVMEVTSCFVSNSQQQDVIIKELGKIDRSDPLGTECDTAGISGEGLVLKKPQDLTVVFAIPRKSIAADLRADLGSDFWSKIASYNEAGAGTLYLLAFLFLALFVLYMGSRRVWKEDVMIDRPGGWYLMEAALIGVVSATETTSDLLVQMIWNADYKHSFSDPFTAFLDEGIYQAVMPAVQTAIVLFFVYSVWYLSLTFIRPVFSLGIRGYIRQYSLIYQVFPWVKRKWYCFVNEIHHIDLGEKSTVTIIKIVSANFIVLMAISMLWFFGIFVLLAYSVILFFILKKNYDKIRKDYRILMQGVNRIAEGDLNTTITEDLGVFEPFRNELSKIRTGFKKAVDDEVKSQKMRTELITNVSHDLKTPLTAITTYIELLKKEDISEEERRSYIETLEKKSQRLKVLIEDLFEISRVSSNSIVLDMIALDVINLVKQVSIEHAERFEQQDLDLRWHVPAAKVMVLLDNQKTYRIFENLFINISKYAMHGSRVYIHVALTEYHVQITIKNISESELNISSEEITERFVRGDSSRNTEGSGLGLAIAKSLTEAQNGHFRVDIDGDLFKVMVSFPLLQEEAISS